MQTRPEITPFDRSPAGSALLAVRAAPPQLAATRAHRVQWRLLESRSPTRRSCRRCSRASARLHAGRDLARAALSARARLGTVAVVDRRRSTAPLSSAPSGRRVLDRGFAAVASARSRRCGRGFTTLAARLRSLRASSPTTSRRTLTGRAKPRTAIFMHRSRRVAVRSASRGIRSSARNCRTCAFLLCARAVALLARSPMRCTAADAACGGTCLGPDRGSVSPATEAELRRRGLPPPPNKTTPDSAAARGQCTVLGDSRHQAPGSGASDLTPLNFAVASR